MSSEESFEVEPADVAGESDLRCTTSIRGSIVDTLLQTYRDIDTDDAGGTAINVTDSSESTVTHMIRQIDPVAVFCILEWAVSSKQDVSRDRKSVV